MLTTACLRTALLSAVAVLALNAHQAGAESPATAAPTTTGALPDTPAQAKSDAAPAQDAPAGAVANAVTPTAPSNAPAAGTEAAAPSASEPTNSEPPKPDGASPAAATPPPASNANETTASPSAPAAQTTASEPAKPSDAAAAPAAAAGTASPNAAAPAPASPQTAEPATGAAPAQATTPSENAAAPAPTDPAQPATAAAPPAAPVADPVVVAVRAWLAVPGNVQAFAKDDAAAAVAFYEARNGAPLWIEGSSFNAKAKSAMDEVRKADDWGLSAAAFDLPSLTGSPAPEALAEAEGKLTLALLKYARFARGGRVNPTSLSRILDQVPPVRDPNVVLTELAASSTPDAFLRDQHPQHQGFKNLHKALLAARGPAKTEADVDPALKVVLPATKITLKRGVDAPQVALLRQRLKVPAEAGTAETLFDEKVELALKAFQVERGIKATGQLSGATRVSLNREVDSHKTPDPERSSLRLILNMERWRWMPEDLGKVNVQNNIPEYMTRVYKDGEVIFKERIVVGLPAWATPVFSAHMEFVGFNPSWGMPDGIKMRELQPRLRAAGGGDFFSQLFGGGGGAAASIRAHGLKVYRGGREISPEAVDWGNADLRQYSFIQPPGPKNPLGMVKFRYPNKHDVYMHDTIERNLFAQSNRALSHGCIRVQNPKEFAAIMLREGNGYDEKQVARAISGGGEIHLEHRIPVHMTYFTAVADEAGKVTAFTDIYGHDGKLSAALTGRTLRLDPVVEMSSNAAEEAPVSSSRQASRKKKKTYQAPDTLADAISGFWLN